MQQKRRACATSGQVQGITAFPQDEGWGRSTCSDHPSNEVDKLDKLWFRMQSLGEKLKEANEHTGTHGTDEQPCPHQQHTVLQQQRASIYSTSNE